MLNQRLEAKQIALPLWHVGVPYLSLHELSEAGGGLDRAVGVQYRTFGFNHCDKRFATRNLLPLLVTQDDILLSDRFCECLDRLRVDLGCTERPPITVRATLYDCAWSQLSADWIPKIRWGIQLNTSDWATEYEHD
jgi:hypothetical protein